MLPQKNRFGKTAVFTAGIIVTGIVLLASWGLPLAITQNQYNNHNYLPIVLQAENLTPSPTNTATATATLTPTPDTCGLEIEEPPIAGNDFVLVTGEIGRLVTIIDATTGYTLGSGTLLNDNGHICPGFLSVPLNYPLIEGHLVLAESDNPHDQFDTAWVQPDTPTATPSDTPGPTPTATNTPTFTPTPSTCGPEFETLLFVGNDFVSVTGEIGRLVTIIDVTTGLTLGSDTLIGDSGHICPGFLSVPLNSPLVEGHLMLVESDSPHDQFDTAWVVPPPPSITPTATPDFCGLKFGVTPVGGFDYVEVTGEIGRVVTITDRITNKVLGFDQLAESSAGWSTCSGYAHITLTELLIEGHLLLAESSNPYDSFDAAWVLSPPPLPTPGVTMTPTSTATPTPTEPFIYLQPNCGSPPDVQFTIQGFNWPQDETIALYWDSSQLQSIINTGSQTSFSQTWQKYGITNGTYEVVAVSNNHTATAVFTAPCPLPPTNTPTPTATATAGPVNLIIGRPILVSTPPIVAYQPVEFQVSIFNTEITPVDSPFFVDIYLDPSTIFTSSIPLNQSAGYQGISSIPGLATRVLTITAPLGFQNEPVQHIAYSMVDSLGQIQETDETDNVSVPLLISPITPAPTPTATSTPPAGSDVIFGIIYRPTNEGLVPLLRANVTLIDTANSETIATTTSDPINGGYSFQNLLPGDYAVTACGSVESDGETMLYAGWRTNVTLPYAFPVNVYTDSSLNCSN